MRDINISNLIKNTNNHYTKSYFLLKQKTYNQKNEDLIRQEAFVFLQNTTELLKELRKNLIWMHNTKSVFSYYEN